MAPRSVTTWSRLEPRTRDRDLRDGLRAAVHDPLWLLGRQWQVGELKGEDGGSLVDATVEITVDPMARFRPGDGDSPDHDTTWEDWECPDDGTASAGADGDWTVDGTNRPPPLETLVERERVRPDDPDDPGKNVRLAAEAGAHFLRLVGDIFSVDITDFPDDLTVDETDADDEGRAYTSVVGGRALDGDDLIDAYDYETQADFESALADDAVDVPLPTGVDPDDQADRDDYWAAIETYREWYREIYAEPDADELAWDDDRLEYDFEVSTGSAGRETVLAADEYEGGRLEWYAFEVDHEGSLEPSDADGPASCTVTPDVVPTPSRFKGMPAYRWWEIEDDGVDFSDVEAASEDLSRLLVLEFGLVYGNDWFTVPVDLPVGSLAEVTTLDLTTTFGETISVDDAVDANDDPTTDWNLFSMALSKDGDDRGLFVPPVLVSTLESDTVEEVEFGRDEAANVGWAIEASVEGTVGQPRDRRTETATEFKPTAPIATAEDADVAYQLSTDVPDNWFPLLPRRVSLGDITLDRGRLYDGDGTAAEPIGTLLSGQLSIPEDELPRTGKTVSRSYQYTRWTDGRTHLWSGRDVAVGRGETDSGLAFDQLVDPRVGEAEPPIDEPDPYPEGDPIPAMGHLVIGEVSPETPGGARENLNQEYVVLENRGGADLDISGWQISDQADHIYEFRAGSTIGPGQRLVVRTGTGDDSDAERYWGLRRQVWNDAGDVVTVRDDDGEIVDQHRYPVLPADVSDGPLKIAEIQADAPGPERQNLSEEYVVFENRSDDTVDLSGWQIEDAVGHEYYVPEGVELPAGETLTLRTGSGTDSETDLYWGSGNPIWNNTGDTVSVYDADSELVLRESYRTSSV